MKTLRYLSMVLVLIVTSIAFTSCSNDDNDEPSSADYASEVSGVYSGQLSTNGYILEDAYLVYINKITSSTVQLTADFLNDPYINCNVTYANGQYQLTNASVSNMSIIVTGRNLTINFLNDAGSITTFNGTRD